MPPSSATVAALGYELVDVERAAGGLLRVTSTIPAVDGEPERVHHGRRLRARHAPAAARAGGRGCRVRAPRGVVARARPAAEESRPTCRAFAGEQVEVTLQGAVQGPQALSRRADGSRDDGDGWRLLLPRRRPRHAASRSARRARCDFDARARCAKRRPGFTLDELQGRRLVPVIDFKGAVRRPAARCSGARASEEADGGRTQ